jgi:hypothetical protein
MKLSELKLLLEQDVPLNFVLPNLSLVPAHFHVTEVGVTTKKFIDCGGTVRTENYVGFQLWCAHDFDHRLSAHKLLSIITISEKNINMDDYEVEVEYQSETIGRYALQYKNGLFNLESKQTNCLAQDQCGIPAQDPSNPVKVTMKNQCNPNSGCC